MAKQTEISPEAELDWRALGRRWGFIGGALRIGLFVLMYFLGREAMLARELWLGSMVIYIWAMYQAQKEVDSDELRAYIQPGFLVFVVANAMFYAFYYLMFTYVDPSLVDLQVAMLEAKDMLKEAGGRHGLTPTIGSTFFEYARSLIMGFIFAAAIGFFLRQRNK